MSLKLYEQIDCTAADGVCLTVWVEAGIVWTGSEVTFKETGDMLWSVVKIYDAKINSVNRGWGLQLPKSQRTER